MKKTIPALILTVTGFCFTAYTLQASATPSEDIEKLIEQCMRDCNEMLTPVVNFKHIPCDKVCRAEANDHMLTEKHGRQVAWCPKKLGKPLWETFLNISDLSQNSYSNYECGGIYSPRNQEQEVDPSSIPEVLGGASVVNKGGNKISPSEKR